MAALTLATVAMGVSGYLAYVGFTESKVVGCDGGVFNCDHVLNSRWSQVLGVPVSAAAIGLYAAVIGALLGLRASSVTTGQLAWATLSTLSVAAAATAFWFVSLQVFSIGHFCPYCLVVHGCGVALAGLVGWFRPAKASSMLKTTGLGITLSACLIAMQAFGPVPETFEVQEHNLDVIPTEFDPLSSLTPSQSHAAEAGETFGTPVSQPTLLASSVTSVGVLSALPWFSFTGMMMDGSATSAPAPRLVPVTRGKHQLDARKWPVWGNVDAKYLIVEMFDYTCDHCRNTHNSMKAAAPMLDNELAVLALPVPLHQSCNDAATNNSPERADACEIARLAISVWLVDASKFTGYHDWLFEQKRTAAEARAYAETLVSSESLAAEMAKGTAAKYISKNVTLYKEAGAGTVPKISFPRTTVIGEMGSAGSVADLVRQQFDQ